MVNDLQDKGKAPHKPSLRVRITFCVLTVCVLAISLFTALEAGLMYNSIETEQRHKADYAIEAVLGPLRRKVLNDASVSQEDILFSGREEEIAELLSGLREQGIEWMVVDRQGNARLVSDSTIQEKLSRDHFSLFADKRIEIDGSYYYTGNPVEGSEYICYALMPMETIRNHIYETIAALFFTLLCILFFVTIAVFAIIWNVTAPLHAMITTISAVSEGNLSEQMPPFSFYELDEVRNVFNEMTSKLRIMIREKYENKLMVRELQLKQLQSQINPHFLFNVLTTIAFKALESGQIEIYEMLNAGGTLLQGTLNPRNQGNTALLADELELVKYFLYLQGKRFPEYFHYTIEGMTEDLENVVIPRLCLEPLVENAAIHGIEPKNSEGHIRIKIEPKDQDLLILIEDDGVGFGTDSKNQTSHPGIGLCNTRQLIENLYGDPYGIEIESKRGVGTKVMLRLPLIRMD